MGTENARLYRWDNVKLFLIFTVVLGHCLDTFGFTGPYRSFKVLFLFIYSFHMPAFIFVSGLFSKKLIEQKNVKKLLPYLFAYFISIAILAIGNAAAGKSPMVKIFSYNGIPWFMLAMFFMPLLTMLLKDFDPRYILIFSIVVSLISGFNKQNNDFLAWMRICTFYPFYYIGYRSDPTVLSDKLNNKRLRVAATAILLLFFVSCVIFTQKLYWFRPLLTGRNSYSALDISSDKYIFMPLLKLVVGALGLLFTLSVSAVIPDKEFKITKLGERTFTVYLLHGFFVRLLFGAFDLMSIFKRITDDPKILLVFTVITAICVTLICSIPVLDRCTKRLFKAIPQN